MKTLRLGALGSSFATIVASQGIIPIIPTRNATAPTPTTSKAVCKNRCTVDYPSLVALQWIPEEQVVYTTNITVATVAVIYQTTRSTTLPPIYETAFAGVPQEYELYPQATETDEKGTAVVNVPIQQPHGAIHWSQFAYPTPYIDYSSEYHWSGVLETQDKAFDSPCATATAAVTVPLEEEHPEYPQPKNISPGKGDPFGSAHVPLWVSHKDEPDKAFFDIAFSSHSAFASCESAAPNIPLQTVFSAPRFVTITKTYYRAVSNPGIIIIQPSAPGFETTTSSRRPRPIVTNPPGDEFEGNPPWTTATEVAHIESRTDGFEKPSSTARPYPPMPQPNPQGVQPDPLQPPQDGKPPSLPANQRPGNPGDVPSPSPPSTPIFTLIPTVVDGKPTSSPAFILPDTSETARINQVVNVNGQPTMLAAPDTFFTTVATTAEGGAPTSIPAYIISGTSTATIGQTVAIHGTTTVLSVPTQAPQNEDGFGDGSSEQRHSDSPKQGEGDEGEGSQQGKDKPGGDNSPNMAAGGAVIRDSIWVLVMAAVALMWL